MKIITLSATEFDIRFYIRRHNLESRVMVSIVMESKSQLNRYKLESKETVVDKKHLIEMTQYLTKHSDEIKNGKKSEAHGYLDYDMLYSLRGTEGVYDPSTDTAFYSLHFLINTGYSQEHHIVWVGGSIGVNSNILAQFAIDIKEAINIIEQDS